MNITHIKCSDLTGLSGLEVTHLVSESKDGVPYLVPTTVEPAYPVHIGLIKKFKELSVHLLNICDICQDPALENAKDFAIEETNVTEITMASDHFVLKGKRNMGDKVLVLKTYKVSADDYLYFAKVQEIFKGIREETEAYCAGNRQITMEELGERVVAKIIAKGDKKSEKFGEEWEAKSKEEKEEFCKKWLFANGAVDVVMESDLHLPDDNVIEFNKAV